MTSDYVYDTDGSLPDGKSDLRPLTAPASKSYVAAEWNTMAAASKSIRNAILGGRFFGLLHDAGSAVSAALGARVRANSGQLQVSENGKAWKRFRGVDYVHVEDYGAVGDGTTDDLAALNNAIAAGFALKKWVQLDAEKTYAISAMIDLDGVHDGLLLRGSGSPAVGSVGNHLATIQLLSSASAQRAVLSIWSNGSRIENVQFDANRKAKYGLFLKGCTHGRFTDCRAINGTRAGFMLPRRTDDTDLYDSGGGGSATVNDKNVFDCCWATANGTFFYTAGQTIPTGVWHTQVSGTVATTSGSKVLTGTGTAFLSLGLRHGDAVCVGTFTNGAASKYYLVDFVTDDIHLNLMYVATASVSGLGYAFGCGAGLWEDTSGDNNINEVRNGLYRMNGGFGVVHMGLAASKDSHPQVEYNAFYGIATGSVSGTSFAWHCDNPYLEANVIAHLLVFGCIGFKITTPEFGDGSYVDYWMEMGANSGTLENCNRLTRFDGLTPMPTIVAIGSTFSTVPVLFTAPDFSIESRFRIWGVASGAIVASSQIPTSAPVSFLQESADLLMTSTPTFVAGTQVGQLSWVTNDRAFGVTLQDNALLAGSKLFLGADRLTLRQNEDAHFRFDGTYWHLVGTSGTLISTADATGSPGTTATQNTKDGRVAISAGNSVFTLTNSRVTTGSKVFAQLQTVDATALYVKAVVCTANTATITLNAAATGTPNIAWDLKE